MAFTRRQALLAGASAGFSLAAPAVLKASEAERRFTILRGGDEIGFHSLRLARVGEELSVEIDIEIVVRFLGIAAYRYEMTNREMWRGGRVISGDSQVNDDGEVKRVVTRREDEALIVDGSNYTGAAPDDAATTTYFAKDFLKRPTWISTDAGDLLSVRVETLGETSVDTPDGARSATRWRVRDDAAYDVEVLYDSNRDWVGLAFDAGGERASYRVARQDSSFDAVWTG
jgi:hypothetical protein